ncbi:MAG: hypothetical protein WD401_01500 [Thermomicrobiaceae bacterium]
MPGSNNGHDAQSVARRRAADIASEVSGDLDEAELVQVTQRIERLFRAIDELRHYPLENSDEPAPVFRPIGKEQP